MRAFILMHDRPGYPLESVVAGAKSLGYSVQIGGVDHSINSKDLLITWTPWRGSLSHRLGEQHKASGGRWIVMENGAISSTREPQYSVGLNGFNGYGQHRNKGMTSERWQSLELDILPWRDCGTHVAVFAQMGGHDLRFTMPPNWPDDIVSRIESLSARPVMYRPKPLRPRYFMKLHKSAKTPDFSGCEVADYLRDAWVAVVYNSKIAVEAIRLGIPALYDGPVSVLNPIVEQGIAAIENPPTPTREQFFWDLAHTQWSAKELESGTPFTRLLV